MASKPQKSWNEIQLAITAIALTATIGLWNLFSSGQKQDVNASNIDDELPTTQEPMQVAGSAPLPTLMPVKIIFGGQAPATHSVVQQQQQPVKKRKAPKTRVSTGSSK